MELKRVVVTGLGALTPVGNTVPETWENIKNGVSGAGPITHFDASKFKTQFACEVKNLKVNDYIDRKEARKMDRYAQLAIISAMQAIQDSGMNLEEISEMIRSLKNSPVVSEAQLNIAKTDENKPASVLSFSVTIYLQQEQEAE